MTYKIPDSWKMCFLPSAEIPSVFASTVQTPSDYMVLMLTAVLQDRMWRKTVTNGTVCNGVDPNRNWDDHWNGTVKCSTLALVKLFQKKGNPCTVIDKPFQCFHDTRALWHIYFRLLPANTDNTNY